MKEELIRAALAGGTGAVGAFVRAWLLALAVASVGFMIAFGMNPYFGQDLFKVVVGGIAMAIALSIPIAVVVAIILIAIKL